MLRNLCRLALGALAAAGLAGPAAAQGVAVTLDVANSAWGTAVDGTGGNVFHQLSVNGIYYTDPLNLPQQGPDDSTRVLRQETNGTGGVFTYAFSNPFQVQLQIGICALCPRPSRFNLAGQGADVSAGTRVKLVFDITPGATVQSVTVSGKLHGMTIQGGKLTLIVEATDPVASASDPDGSRVQAGLGVVITLDKDNTGAASGAAAQGQTVFESDILFPDLAMADPAAVTGAALNADGADGTAGTVTAYIRADYLAAQGITALGVGAAVDGMVPDGLIIAIDPTPVTLNGQIYYRYTITNSAWSARDLQFGQSTGISIVSDVIRDTATEDTLVKTGPGTLILTRANTYTGGTVIDGGTLQLLNSAAAGTGPITLRGSALSYGDGIDVANPIVLNPADPANPDFKLDVAAGAAATQSGVISETGGSFGLEKTGGGTLTLAGANTYTGDTRVSAGVLSVTGALTSRVRIGTGATLGGTGSVAGITVEGGGTLAPGTSIGTLTSTGGTSFEAGSTFAVEIDPSGAADRLVETGAVAIAATGTTLAVSGPLAAYPATSPTYTVIEAGGGVAGAFATVEDTLPDLDFVVSYGATTVTLTYTGAADDTTPKEVHGTGLAALPGAAAFGTLPGVARDAMSGGGRTLSTKGYIARGAAGGRRGWGQILGVLENANATGAVPGWQANTGGLIAGADLALGGGASVLGVALAYTDTGVSSGDSSADVSGLHAALYGGHSAGPFALSGSLGIGFQDYRFVRRFTAAGAAQRATGTTTGLSLTGAVEAFYDAAAAAGWAASGASAFSLGPVARLSVANGQYGGFTETGAGVLNLTVADTSVTQIRGVLGLAGALDIGLGAGRLTLDGEIGWEHVFQGRSVTTASSIGVAGAVFSTGTAPIDSDRVAVGLGAAYAVSDRTTLTFRYDGRIGGRSGDHRASAGIRILF